MQSGKLDDDLSPFLKIGVTLALHRSVGSCPVSRDLSNITLVIGAISSLGPFRSSGLSLQMTKVKIIVSKYNRYQEWSRFGYAVISSSCLTLNDIKYVSFSTSSLFCFLWKY